MVYRFPHKPCTFCRFLEDPPLSVVIEETPHSLSFVPEIVRLEGALLVISRRHVRSSLELTSEESLDLLHTVRRAAAMIEQVFDPDGLNIWWATGVLAGQTEPHLHVELVPRHEGIEYKYEDMDQLPAWSLAARSAIADKFREMTAG
jgi:histidine triad (HIT) family protein